MNPELAVLYAKLDIYQAALKDIEKEGCGECGNDTIAESALEEATKLSQPASEPEKP